MATSQDFVNWVCGPELNRRYLRYIFMLEQDSVRRFAHGTTHQTMYYPEAKALNVLLPSRARQDAIAEVLGALDDKIAANDRTHAVADKLCSAEVQAAAQRGGRTELREVLALRYGKSLPASRRVPGKVPVYGSSGQTGTHTNALVDRPGVVVGRKGTVGAIHWVDSPHFPIDTTYYVEPIEPGMDEVLYYILRGMPLNQLNADSAVPGLNRENAYEQQVKLPTADACAALSKKLRSYFAWMSSVRGESRTLAHTRDELLPLLMSGELRVRDAEKAVEEVV